MTSAPVQFIFCDESGNSGPDLLDASQPVYVFMGLMTPAPGEPIVSEVLDRLRNAFGIPFGDEIHAKELLRRAYAWDFVRKLIEGLGAVGCIPSYVIAEKRYVIAAKAVETYLDPLYNDRVGDDLTYDTSEKEQLANSLYDLPDPVLVSFAQAYRDRHGPSLKAALDSMCSALRATGRDRISILLAGSRRVTDRIAADEAGGEVGVPGKGYGTLNLPVFFNAIHIFEGLARLAGARDVEIVHDEQREFGATLRWCFELARHASEGHVRLANGGELFLPIRCLTKLAFPSSGASAGVQAADVLAGALRRPATQLVLGKTVEPKARSTAGLLLAALLSDEPKIANVIASDSFIKRVMLPTTRAVLESGDWA